MATWLLALLIWLVLGFISFGWCNYSVWKNHKDYDKTQEKYKILDPDDFNIDIFEVMIIYTGLGPASLALHRSFYRQDKKEGCEPNLFKFRMGWKLV